MKTISEVMSRDAVSVTPDDNIRRAAELMKDLDIGALPVTENNHVIGMITDRDITIRATAEGLGPEDTQVTAVMSAEICQCYEAPTLDEVMRDMGLAQVRRIPVVTRGEHALVGIVSLADLTQADADGEETLETLREISSPMPVGRETVRM